MRIFGRIAADSSVNYIIRNNYIIKGEMIKRSYIFGSIGISSLLQMAIAGIIWYECYRRGGCFIGNNNFGNYYFL